MTPDPAHVPVSSNRSAREPSAAVRARLARGRRGDLPAPPGVRPSCVLDRGTAARDRRETVISAPGATARCLDDHDRCSERRGTREERAVTSAGHARRRSDDMPAFDPFALALAALAVDAVVGDPPALYRPGAASRRAPREVDRGPRRAAQRRIRLRCGAFRARSLRHPPRGPRRGGHRRAHPRPRVRGPGRRLHHRGRRREHPHCVPKPARPRARRGAGARDRHRGGARRRRPPRGARPRESRRSGSRPGGNRVGGGELLGRGGRAALLVRASRPAGTPRLQGDQHPRQHDRPPRPPPSPLRPDRGAARRHRELDPGPAFRRPRRRGRPRPPGRERGRRRASRAPGRGPGIVR